MLMKSKHSCKISLPQTSSDTLENLLKHLDCRGKPKQDTEYVMMCVYTEHVF